MRDLQGDVGLRPMEQKEKAFNCVVLLGPTAVGKTALGVRIAKRFGWEIISADSRQTYRGLDIGSGKDLADYDLDDGSGKITHIPYHLIDVADLGQEYNVFNFQQDFYDEFRNQCARNLVPFVVGGTGMYIDSVVRGYDFVPVPENPVLRAELDGKSLEELDEMLLSLKDNLHNKSDLLLRERVVRAIEIELYMRSPECEAAREKMGKRPEIRAFVLGTTLERDEIRKNIEIRLKQRLDEGMIDEVRNLHEGGVSWERLEKLGLEYRFISLFLEGKLSRDEMYSQLYHAICQFAKRQETWFRGMERKGVKINWLPRVNDRATRLDAAFSMLEEAGF